MILVNTSKHRASGVEAYMGRHMAISPGPAGATKRWYTYRIVIGEGGEASTETQRNNNNEAKAHWSPRWPNNDIRKEAQKKYHEM